MARNKARNIGIDAKPPKDTCNDKLCPWHGTLSARGKILDGTVASTRAQKTAIVEKRYYHYLTKYQRYERRHNRISAYNPECVAAKEGDVVRMAECRPLSKTKAFVVIEVVKRKSD